MRSINVIAFGGLGGSVFSAGLKTLLLRLDKVPGIDFKTYEDYSSWPQWESALRRWRDPTVLIGHSFGVTAMLAVARAKAGPSLPLAISFDPSQWWWSNPSLMRSGGNAVPARIDRVVNYYQGSGLIGRQTLARPDGSARNIQNFLVSDTEHGAIEDRADLQTDAVTLIKRVISRLNEATSPQEAGAGARS